MVMDRGTGESVGVKAGTHIIQPRPTTHLRGITCAVCVTADRLATLAAKPIAAETARSSVLETEVLELARSNACLVAAFDRCVVFVVSLGGMLGPVADANDSMLESTLRARFLVLVAADVRRLGQPW